MSELRKKSHSLLLRTEGKTVSVELFPADRWPEQNTGEGLYRARVNDVWHTAMGQFTFLPVSAVGALVAGLLHGREPVQPPAKPKGLDKPRRVRINYGPCSGGLPMQSELAWTLTPPHMGADGRWHIWVSAFNGKMCLPVDDVEKVGR